MIEHAKEGLSIRRQSVLLGVNRSGVYYVRKGLSRENLAMMRLIDRQYTRTPFYGVERMTEQLRREGHVIGHNRVRRLMRLMGLEALYPRPRTTKAAPEHKIYPYLLRGVSIDGVNQVWSADITYVPLLSDFVYLVAILDWYSRYVLSWALSRSLQDDFCVAALDEALENNKPEIFNTDQGSQFTSGDFTGRLKDAQVAISMDGRGRVFDNIFTERFWRTVKYEEVYIRDYRSFEEARRGIGAYMQFYNHERFHQSLGYRTPAAVQNDAADTAMAVSACEGMAFHLKESKFWS